ncbi:MAG: alpha/beta fold hydrolase [Candidatus Baltobacteraceae bacterium]
MVTHAILALAVAMRAPASGAYRLAGRTVYVGPEAEPSDRPTTQYYDSKTRRIGTLTYVSGHEYKTDGSPSMVFRLNSPASAVVEQPFVIEHGANRLGASLWHAPGAKRRATIVLIHGADDETRATGFLIPYFVSHGLNVVTYDQRGTGISTGNWQYTSPVSKADDVVAALNFIQSDSAVDARRVGAWAVSNGGWVAPIVATRFPLAFMILKSSPSGSIAENIVYEIGQDLHRSGHFNPKHISDALAFERMMMRSLETNAGWLSANQALIAARSQPWFPYMRIPPGMTAPPPARMLAALQAAAIYDPASLQRTFMPTLALFGTLDHNVDAPRSIARMRELFDRAGRAGDLTVVTLSGAGHTLERSATGFMDDPLLPERFVAGYPETMISWLREKGFVRAH